MRQTIGRHTRNLLLWHQFTKQGFGLGSREIQIEQGLKHGFSGTKGPWTNAPQTRIGNLTGPGATYSFKNQEDGALAFMEFASPELHRNFQYTLRPIYDRLGSALTEDVETRMVGLMGGNFNDIEAVSVATGQAATAMVIKMFTSVGVAQETISRRTIQGTQLNRGRHGIIIPTGGMYGCSFDHIRELAEFEGRDVHALNLNDTDSVRDTLKKNPHIKLILCEALNNPNVTLVDIQALAKLRNEINQEMGYEGKDKIKLAVDLTFTTTQIRPFEWQKELQPDAVFVSATKLTAGGSYMGGFVVAPREHIAGERKALYLRKDTGAIMSDPVAYEIITSGLPTILRRAAITQNNAWEFAQVLEKDDRVTVYYPGLESYGQYELAQRLMQDHDGIFAPSHMVRIHLNPPVEGFGRQDTIETIARRLVDKIAGPDRFIDKIWPGFLYAVSLGNDRGLMSQSSTTTQAVMALKQSLILPDQLLCGPQDLRLSLGWLASSKRAIDQFMYALDYAYANYRH